VKNKKEKSMDMVMRALSNLPIFALYFSISLVLVGIYLTTYVAATAHNEFTLIRNNVVAAALALGLSMIGFVIPLSSAIIYAQSIVEYVVWGGVAILVQILVYWLVRLIIPNLSERIARNEIAAALFVGAASLAAGIINAATMTF
jgi:putative membrane protein